MPQYAISDVHGCADTLKALLNRIGPTGGDVLFFLGDYIDRGPNSKGVVDILLELEAGDIETVCLRGNHEELLLRALQDESRMDNWIINGGMTTIESYLEEESFVLPPSHKHFYNRLPRYHLTPEYVLVHAGLNFGLADPLEDEHSLIWIRGWYNRIDPQWLNGRLIVHGHTPIPKLEIIRMRDQTTHLPVIDIDCGCVFDSPYYRHLCALELESRELYFQPNIDTNN